MRPTLSVLRGDLRALRALQAPQLVSFDPLNGWVPSSAAFKAQSDGTISVDLEEPQLLDNKPLTHGYPRIPRSVGLVAHTVARLTTDGFSVTHAPIAKDEKHEQNDYHGLARGNLSRGKRQALAEQCEIVVPIQGDEAQRLQDEQLAREAQKAKASGAFG